MARASWIRLLGGFDRYEREALVNLLDRAAPPCLPVVLLLAPPLCHRLKLGQLGGRAHHGRGGGRSCTTVGCFASCWLQFHPVDFASRLNFICRDLTPGPTWHKQRWVEPPSSYDIQHTSRCNSPPSEWKIDVRSTHNWLLPLPS